MSVRNALLGLLAQGPQHGYELKAVLERELVPLTPVNYGQVYTALERLERDGMVTHLAVSQEERPDKKVYSLTDRGRAALWAWLGSPTTPSLDLRNEAFVKLVLAARLRRLEQAVDPLEVLAVERRAAFEQLHQVQRGRLDAEEGGSPAEVRLLLSLAALRLEAFLKWLDECERVFGDGGSGPEGGLTCDHVRGDEEDRRWGRQMPVR